MRKSDLLLHKKRNEFKRVAASSDIVLSAVLFDSGSRQACINLARGGVGSQMAAEQEDVWLRPAGTSTYEAARVVTGRRLVALWYRMCDD